MTVSRHEPWDELISASLTGDLSREERTRLDGHLDACRTCRSTLASFADQRRIVAGVRHVPPPRDLGARVRAGIERGAFAPAPWWRRPAALVAGGGVLAVAAGAVMAFALVSEPERNVGEATPSPAAATSAVVTEGPRATFPVAPTPAPTPSAAPTTPATAAPTTPATAAPTSTATPTAAPTPTAEPDATATPAPASPEPDLFLALTGPADNLALTIRDGTTGETLFEVDTPPGPPVAAELSPDGQWLAYVARVGESGMHEVRATRVAEGVPSDDRDEPPPADSPVQVGETVVLGQSLSGSPFLERLAWSSPRSLYLAYTLLDPDDGSTDVWVFEPALGEPYRLTDVGNAYAASWVPGSAGSSLLWVSIADEEPVSYLVPFHDDARAEAPEPIDPVEVGHSTARAVFQPIVSPNGRFAIYWDGRMERVGDDRVFVGSGQPHLAEHRVLGDAGGFENERPLFSDLGVGRDGFASAAITWGGDSIAYAVWNAQWTGTPQSGASEDQYPDPSRVYFGHATDPRGLTRVHAIDRGDVPPESVVVDVEVSPTGEHLVVTALRPIGGVLEAPGADLLLVERNTGDEPDLVTTIGDGHDGWFGPAAFDAQPEAADGG